MGRKKKSEKQYVTASEWIRSGGGKLPEVGKGTPFKALPFDCCALSLLPFEDPVATPDGTVFDILNIVPYIKKYKKNPVTGEPLAAKDLIRLTFHKNTDGQYICPITYKAFSPHSRIVFIRTTGHVYSMEAIEQLNIKTGNWTDLITGEKFTKKDIITIQDPLNLQKRDITTFKHLEEPKDEEQSTEPLANINLNEATTRIFSELKEKVEQSERANKKRKTAITTAPPKKPERPADPPLSSSASFTCAGYSEKPVVKREVKVTKKKGYVRLHTNAGDINLELHCDIAPKACENFLLLCSKGYYNNVIFHRNIPKFMIQGGDPTGTGRGGQSAWGKPFYDEFSPKLLHDARGVLSMANSGPETNGSQFFILYGPATHLNNKHTVFGRVVGGMDVLDTLEKVPTDRNDKPLTDLIIAKTTVFVNPLDDDALAAERQEEEERELAKKKKESEEREMGQWYSNPNPVAPRLQKNSGVGKYIAPSNQPSSTMTTTRAPLALGKVQNDAQKRKRTQFDFSGW